MGLGNKWPHCRGCTCSSDTSSFFYYDLGGEITLGPFYTRDVFETTITTVTQNKCLHHCIHVVLTSQVFKEIHLVNYITIEIRTHFNILPQTVVIFLYFMNPGHLVHTKVHSFLCQWLCGKRSQIFSFYLIKRPFKPLKSMS